MKTEDKSGNISPRSNAITFSTLPLLQEEPAAPEEGPLRQGKDEASEPRPESSGREPPLSFSEGDLIRAIADSKIYIIRNGRKFWVPTLEAFAGGGYGWSDVREVPVSDIESTVSGNLIRIEGREEVYEILGNKKRHITSAEEFVSGGYIWDNVVDVSDAEASWYNNINYSDVNLLRAANDTKVYLIEGARKRWIETADIFIRLGYDWDSVVDVPAVVLDGYFTVETIRDEKVPVTEPTVPQEPAEIKPREHTIFVGVDGFAPGVITITAGDTVRWVNSGRELHWPASDFHPTHKNYAGLDPLQAILPGGEWSFTFEKVGDWGIHDHLNSTLKGKVVVLEEN